MAPICGFRFRRPSTSKWMESPLIKLKLAPVVKSKTRWIFQNIVFWCTAPIKETLSETCIVFELDERYWWSTYESKLAYFWKEFWGFPPCFSHNHNYEQLSDRNGESLMQIWILHQRWKCVTIPHLIIHHQTILHITIPYHTHTFPYHVLPYHTTMKLYHHIIP